MHDILVLLSLPLELLGVAVDFLLEIKVLLEQLIPLPLALPFSLLELIDDSPVLDVLLGDILQELGEDQLLLLALG